MSLAVYNTLTRCKEPFTTLEPGKVTMYCCGVTVYDYCHLGHARSYIVWDVVRRYLQWRGYQVRYVQNFTDIDDKILNRARAEGSSMKEIADRYIDAYFEDIRRLNVMDAEEYPHVTEHIPAIHHLIQGLQDQGYAYAVDGDVYYKVRQFAEYGKLSRRQLEQMQSGAGGRVDPDDPEGRKQDPFDFALWKAAKPGEPAWDSPWGKGRPGWHIECSAMIRARLGETIDIHGGGGDLVFPHHENEIAQSEVLTGKSLASYWLHNGMVTVNGEKMSKSLGNFTTIRELLDKPVAPMVVRLFVLQAHYRKPLDFTEEAIASAEKSWNTLEDGLQFGNEYGELLGWKSEEVKEWKSEEVKEPSPPYPTSSSPLYTSYIQQFQSAMDDDFNTAGTLAVLFDLAKQLRREGNLLAHDSLTSTPPEQIWQKWLTLVHLTNVLGLKAEPPDKFIESDVPLSVAEIEAFIQKRQEARRAKKFTESDRIRNELQAVGITLIDQQDGQTRWHRS